MQVFSSLHVHRLEVTCDVQNASTTLFRKRVIWCSHVVSVFPCSYTYSKSKSVSVFKSSTVPSMRMGKFGVHAVLTSALNKGESGQPQAPTLTPLFTVQSVWTL